jgi:hypothetical protein
VIAAISVSGVNGFAQNSPEADFEAFARLPIALILS